MPVNAIDFSMYREEPEGMSPHHPPPCIIVFSYEIKKSCITVMRSRNHHNTEHQYQKDNENLGE